MSTALTRLWALRWTTGMGWRWTRERECEVAWAAEWLEQFKRIEPTIEFKIAARQPRVTPGTKAPLTNIGFAS